MIEIPLSSERHPGLVALVDDEDAELVAGHTWWLFDGTTSKTVYAYTQIAGKTVYMHRLIAGAAPGQKVDHEDRNGLKNTWTNLRFGTSSQHQANKGMQRNNTSGYIGVSWNELRGTWKAFVGINRKRKTRDFPGTDEGRDSAARWRDKAALEAFGEFAVLNFPDERLVA